MKSIIVSLFLLTIMTTTRAQKRVLLTNYENTSINQLFDNDIKSVGAFVTELENNNGNAVLQSKKIKGDFVMQKASNVLTLDNIRFDADASIIISAKNNLNILSGSTFAPDRNGAITLYVTDFEKLTQSEKRSMPNSTNTVYPNPAKDVLQLQLQEKATGTVIILDVKGVKISETAISDFKQSFDVSNLPTGVYLLKVISPTINESFQFLKQ